MSSFTLRRIRQYKFLEFRYEFLDMIDIFHLFESVHQIIYFRLKIWATSLFTLILIFSWNFWVDFFHFWFEWRNYFSTIKRWEISENLQSVWFCHLKLFTEFTRIHRKGDFFTEPHLEDFPRVLSFLLELWFEQIIPSGLNMRNLILINSFNIRIHHFPHHWPSQFKTIHLLRLDRVEDIQS